MLLHLWPKKKDSGDSHSPPATVGQNEDDDEYHPLLQSLEMPYVNKKHNKTSEDISLGFPKPKQTLFAISLTFYGRTISY